MSVQAVVKRKRRSRKGKGFSREELREVGLSFKQALKLKIPIDTRRSTKHEENVKTLERYLGREHPKRKREVTTPEVVIELTKVKGIGPKLLEKFKKAGISNVNELIASKPEKLAKATGISEKRASRFIESARSLLKEIKKKAKK